MARFAVVVSPINLSNPASSFLGLAVLTLLIASV